MKFIFNFLLLLLFNPAYYESRKLSFQIGTGTMNKSQHSGTWYVLIGGDAAETQGVSPESRYLEHASLPFIGAAYAKLRSAGVPRSRIITICQLNDTLDVLKAGARGDFEGQTRIPTQAYQSELARTEHNCSLLIEEGGADYDGKLVNPGTVWNVLLGLQNNASETQGKYVPVDDCTVFFAIYSHGNSHPAVSEANHTDIFQNEWYCHFPYESSHATMYDFVATKHAPGNPRTYLYATQLRAILAMLFARNPNRPVIGLLNYCLSGGGVEFMRRPVAQQAYQSNKWPLFLMSSASSQADALVGGLWESWFDCLSSCLQEECNQTLEQMYKDVIAAYRRSNQYDLLNHVKRLAYPDLGHLIGTEKDHYSTQLWSLLSSGKDGEPAWGKLVKLQKAYRKLGIPFRPSLDWDGEVDLVKSVKKAMQQIVMPEVVFGTDSGIHRRIVGEVFSSMNDDDPSKISCENYETVSCQDNPVLQKISHL